VNGKKKYLTKSSIWTLYLPWPSCYAVPACTPLTDHLSLFIWKNIEFVRLSVVILYCALLNLCETQFMNGHWFQQLKMHIYIPDLGGQTTNLVNSFVPVSILGRRIVITEKIYLLELLALPLACYEFSSSEI